MKYICEYCRKDFYDDSECITHETICRDRQIRFYITFGTRRLYIKGNVSEGGELNLVSDISEASLFNTKYGYSGKVMLENQLVAIYGIDIKNLYKKNVNLDGTEMYTKIDSKVDYDEV